MTTYFEDLGLSDEVLDSLDEVGYEIPTEVQEKAIPAVLAGRDVVACAPTGTGKTAAFVLPTVDKIAGKPGLRALIVCPTRELAVQSFDAARQYARYSQVQPAVFYGGMPLAEQDAQLHLDLNLIVATPGRLLDFLHRRTFDLLEVEILVLDEADRMLDMGFMPDIEEILMMMPQKERQTLLFSATMPREILGLAKRCVTDPVPIRVKPRDISASSNIRHYVYPVQGGRTKDDLFLALLDEHDVDTAVVFVRTKERVEEVGRLLERKRLRHGRMHSDRTQEHRERTLRDFRDGKISILVATDVASRGLDIDHISHVINYDVPLDPDDYVHRAGRTGRMDATGESLTLATPSEGHLLRKIEKYTGSRLPIEIHPRYGYDGPMKGKSGNGRGYGGGGGRGKGGGGRGKGGGGRRR